MFIQQITIRIQIFCVLEICKLSAIVLTSVLLLAMNVMLYLFWIIKKYRNCMLQRIHFVFRVLKGENFFFKILLQSSMCLSVPVFKYRYHCYRYKLTDFCETQCKHNATWELSSFVLCNFMCTAVVVRLRRGLPGQANNLAPLQTDINISDLFQWCFSAPYRLAPQTAAQLAHPIIWPVAMWSWEVGNNTSDIQYTCIEKHAAFIMVLKRRKMVAMQSILVRWRCIFITLYVKSVWWHGTKISPSSIFGCNIYTI
jgi:hypothetical protein